MRRFLVICGFALAAEPLFAAITSNVTCKNSQGLTVYWETTRDNTEDGQPAESSLYQNKISVNIGADELVFVPNSAVVSFGDAVISAAIAHKQFIHISARKLIKDDGDLKLYRGTARLRLLRKDGKYLEDVRTRVTCEVFGEA
jgi:hypothetical protein